MVAKDYYKILGVARGTNREEIKKAYKKLAMKYHPDRAPADKKSEYEELFKEISEAAAVLSDDKKRQQYDQFGSAGPGTGAGDFAGFDYSDIMSQFRSGVFGSNFDDIFDQLFSGGRHSSRAQRGSDLLYEVTISLEQAATGITRDINLRKMEHCPHCQGKGAHTFQQCHHCHGSGYLKKTQRTPFGLFQQTGPCPYCHARGELPQDSCSECQGEGIVHREKTVEVSIPAGVQDSMRLRVSGEGEVGDYGAASGDLYILVRVKSHQFFERKDDDLHITVPLSFSQAALGDEIEVPTITGRAVLTIPEGTQSETIFRMRGKGLPHVQGGGHGDQMVNVHVTVPKKLTKKQKELIQELHEEKPLKSLLQKIFG